MKAVIAPEDDPCVVCVGRLVEGVQELPDLCVHKGDASQVGLNGVVPLIVLDDPLVAWGDGAPGEVLSVGGDIGQVVRNLGWEEDLITRVEVEPAGWSEHGDMGSVETAGQEEG